MTSEIAEQRAALQAAWAGQTMCDALAATAEQFGDLPAYSDRDGSDPWQTVTWAQTREQALALAAGFAELGLQPGDKVALMLPNRLEHVLADLGVLHAGGRAGHLLRDPRPGPDRVHGGQLRCEDRGHRRRQRARPLAAGAVAAAVAAPGHRPGRGRVPGRRAVHELARLRRARGTGAGERPRSRSSDRIAAIRPDDPVTLLYTSGTTGNPKGVIITHANALYEVETARAGGNAPMHVRWVSYLPLAHIAERMFTLYLAICNACHTYFCHDAATQLIATMSEVRPTAFFGVPRIFEKVMAGIQALLAGEQDEARKAAVAAAMATGLEYVRSCSTARPPPPSWPAKFAAADEQVLRPIRSLLGLGEAEIVVSGAAPLPPEVGEFFGGLGVRILDVYGMSETTGAFTTNTPQAFRLGTVGRPVPGIEVRSPRTARSWPAARWPRPAT